MDICAELIRYLDNATSIEWYHDAPHNAPKEYGTITRDGGASELVRDMPTLTLIVHGSTRARAESLSFEAKNALFFAVGEVDNLFRVEVLSRYYDPLDGAHRYRITASLITND